MNLLTRITVNVSRSQIAKNISYHSHINYWRYQPLSAMVWAIIARWDKCLSRKGACFKNYTNTYTGV